MRRLPALIGSAALLWSIAAAGYVPAPNDAEIAAAAAKGAALAAARQGYLLADYIIYRVKDPLALDPTLGSVDAIQVATPLERTRHAAFLGAYGARALAPAEARAQADLPDGWLEIIVFAHGDDRKDKRFGERFRTAVLRVGDRLFVALSVSHSDPDRTEYPHSPHDSTRYAGTVTYRFDLSRLGSAGEKPGILELEDATEKQLQVPVDLRRYP